MKQPTMKISSTGDEYKVASLVRMDGGSTLRAFPLRALDNPMSYVIIQGDGEDTLVNATLIY